MEVFGKVQNASVEQDGQVSQRNKNNLTTTTIAEL